MKITVAPAILVLFILGVGAAILWFLLPTLVSGIWQAFRASWIIFLIVAILVGMAAACFAGEASFLGGLLVVGVFVAMIFGGTYLHYSQLKAVSGSVMLSDESPNTLSFKERAPFDVATATSSRTLGNTTGDATGVIRALPALGEHGQYSTSVIRRGIFKGYESTQMLTPPLFGSATSADASFCQFSENASLRFGGAGFNNNLSRAIAHAAPLGTRADQGDAFVVCEGDTPKLYAPLTKQVGFVVTKRVPAGVAVYNGTTGELNIERELKGDLPYYPQSLATMQRESTTAMNGYWDWTFNRSGFEDTGKDASDPNGGTRAEFGLANIGQLKDRGAQSYVTPLNSRGSSSSIVGLGTVDASSMQIGQLNDYSVRVYPEGESRQANSAVADSITGGLLDGYRASGLRVFEIVPAEDGAWVASIGKAQAILYRVAISATGELTLVDGDMSDGAGPRSGEPAAAPAGKVDLDSPIGSLSTSELRALGDQVLAELAARATESADHE